MNIFILDSNPVISARQNCDKHCSKIVLEIAQMMASCFEIKRLQDSKTPRTKVGTPYKHSHYNHPVTKWIRESKDNFLWALQHAEILDNERRIRNGGLSIKPEHFSFKFIHWAAENINDIKFPKNELTPFAIAINSKNNCYRYIQKYNLKNDPVLAYRLYYKLDKPFATWKRNRPNWMDYSVEEIIEFK